MFFFKMLKTQRVFVFTDASKHSEKLQLFNMCSSQDIVKISSHQISFKLDAFKTTLFCHSL